MRTALHIAVLVSLALAGCDNLSKGTKIKPLTESEYFSDGQSSRRPPAHSVARGNLRGDALLYEGRNLDGSVATMFPWTVTVAALARGQQQYLAICANCHGADGYGNGIIVRRGFPAPPSLHEDRLRDSPLGHLFDVITNGHGAMAPYAPIVKVNDRWAIVAYVRALQRSQHSAIGDVPPQELAQLQSEAAPQ